MKLAEVCRIVGGGTPSKKNKAYYSGNIPWASVRDMNNPILTSTEFRISDEAVRESATNVIPAGEVIISTHVGLGKVCILAQDTAINQDLKAVIPTVDIDRRYLYHWFVSQAPKLVAAGKGATVKGVTVKFVLDLVIPIPSRNSQQSIAKQLSLVLECVKKRQAQLARLDALAKSLFVEMFETGNYKEVYLEEVVYPDRPITYGVVKPGKEVPGGVPIIKVKDFPDGAVKKTNILHASPEIEKGYKRSRVVTGDLLYSIRGTVGRMAFVPKELDGANITQDTARVSIDRNRFQPTYIMASLSVPDIRRVIEGKIKGGAVKGINLSDLRKIKIPLAGQSDQIEFARQIQLIDKSKFAIRKSLDELNRLYRSLLQQYFG